MYIYSQEYRWGQCNSERASITPGIRHTLKKRVKTAKLYLKATGDVPS